jgi:hypothetical protein
MGPFAGNGQPNAPARRRPGLAPWQGQARPRAELRWVAQPAPEHERADARGPRMRLPAGALCEVYIQAHEAPGAGPLRVALPVAGCWGSLAPGGVDGRFTPEMPVIWMPGPWVTAALRPGDRPAALSCGRSHWAHRFSGSEIENKNHWAGQVQVVPPFWSHSPSVEEGSGPSTFEGCRDPPKCRFARESRGARSQPVYEALQEVAPPHARPHSRSARIGSFCDLVAALVWVQAWVGAVGRVRNASPIRNDSMLPNVEARPCSTGTFVTAHSAEARHELLLCAGCVQASKQASAASIDMSTRRIHVAESRFLALFGP